MIDITEARQYLAAMSPGPYHVKHFDEAQDVLLSTNSLVVVVSSVHNTKADSAGLCYMANCFEELLDELEALRANRETFKEIEQSLIEITAIGQYYLDLVNSGLLGHRAFDVQPLDEINRYYRMAEEQLAAKWPGVFQ